MEKHWCFHFLYIPFFLAPPFMSYLVFFWFPISLFLYNPFPFHLLCCFSLCSGFSKNWKHSVGLRFFRELRGGKHDQCFIRRVIDSVQVSAEICCFWMVWIGFDFGAPKWCDCQVQKELWVSVLVEVKRSEFLLPFSTHLWLVGFRS